MHSIKRILGSVTCRLRRYLPGVAAMVFLAAANGASAQANLTITKSASQTTITNDQQVTFTLAIANVGDATATGVSVTDDLSARLEFVSATAGGSAPPGPGSIVTWNLPDIPPGASGSIAVTVQPFNVADDQTVTVSNDAQINYNGGASATSNPVQVTITPAPALTLQKSASVQDAQPGDIIIYTLDIANEGGSEARNVVLSDTLDAGLSFVSANGGGVFAGGTITWNLGTVAAGQSGAVSFQAQVNPLPDNTAIPNSATISADAPATGASAGPVNVTVDANATLDVAIEASHNPIEPGQILQFTTRVTNSSTNTAENVQVVGSIPANTTYVSNVGGGSLIGNTVTWDLGDIAAGATQSVVLVVLVDGPPLADNTPIQYGANASAGNASGAGGQLIVYVSSRPELTLEKTTPVTVVSPGDTFTYTLAYSNVGTTAATSVVIDDFLPPATTFQSLTGPGSHTAGRVTWNIPSLAAGASGSVTVTVRVNDGVLDGTLLQNVSSIESLSGLPVSAPVVDVRVSNAPQLNLVKRAARPRVAPGDQLLYYFDYSNTGAGDALNVEIIDSLPPGTTFVSASNGGTESGGVVTWNLRVVRAGESGTLQVTVSVDDSVAPGTELNNQASINSDQTAVALSSLVTVLVALPTSIPTLPLPWLALLALLLACSGLRTRRR